MVAEGAMKELRFKVQMGLNESSVWCAVERLRASVQRENAVFFVVRCSHELASVMRAMTAPDIFFLPYLVTPDYHGQYWEAAMFDSVTYLPLARITSTPTN